jgi:hypothetical protein
MNGEADNRQRLPVQLLMYRFGHEARFEGGLVGALERMEAGGALRILEALFVSSSAETGELIAIDLRGRGGGGGITAPLLDFRLDERARRRATERALAGSTGLPPETLRALGATLEPGATVVAVLVEHVWARALEDAVSRLGGSALATEFVDAGSLADLGPDLLTAAGR